MKVLAAIVLCLGVAVAIPLTVINEGDPLQHEDCHSVWRAGHRTNGTYRLTINGSHHEVPCAFNARFAFTIILYRVDSIINWKQSWNVYRAGFGHPLHDYFSGLDNLHQLTKDGRAGLDIRFMDWDNNELYYTYSSFYVADVSRSYQLHLGGRRTGNVKPDMDFNNGMCFYTWDRPDAHNCSVTLHGGWWYNYEYSTNFCTKANPTGFYYDRQHCCPSTYSNGIIWGSYRSIGPYHGGHYSLKRFVMSIRHDL